MPSGSDTRSPSSSPRCKYGPYRPTRATTPPKSGAVRPARANPPAEERDRVAPPGVDLAEPLGDHPLQAAQPRDRAFAADVAAEVERAQEVDRRGFATGDLVQLVLHAGGEGVV